MNSSIGHVLRESWVFFRYLVVGLTWGMPFAYTSMIQDASEFPLYPHLTGMLAPWTLVFILAGPVMSLLGILLVALGTPMRPRLAGSSAIGAIGAVLAFTLGCILILNYRLGFIIGLPVLALTGVIATLLALIKRRPMSGAMFVVAWAAFSWLVWNATQWQPGREDWSSPASGLLLLVGVMFVAFATFSGTVAAFCVRTNQNGGGNIVT